MRRITLIVRDSVDPCLPIEAEVITPETLCKTVRVNVYVGNRKMQLSDVFDIRVDGESAGPGVTEIVLIGDASCVKRVGEYMTDGRIIVDGDIGMHCGDFMTGGTIEIMGNAGDWLGREMLGGKILCQGKAGNYWGSPATAAAGKVCAAVKFWLRAVSGTTAANVSLAVLSV
ncbi:MAG TPA: hypothetical protein O0X38_00650 [Methanocorpusculum sp.]|nr:hypothetical protein [Methanocorpusculum sp.]